MVTLHKSQMTVSEEKQPMPVMYKHSLTVKKSAPGGFNEGDTILCFIARYDNNRYCVFTASFIRIDHYHVFDSEEQLHEHFEE
jgi:hypothetical protein